MSKRSITHGTFVVERGFPFAPEKIFAAWADLKIKRRWFGDPGAVTVSAFDFRVGGRESSSGKSPNGHAFRFDALYQDIVPNERIVYTYDMHLNDRRISVSLATIELRAEGKGTKMVVTEMGAYLDGLDNPAQRETGTKFLLDKLGEVVAGG